MLPGPTYIYKCPKCKNLISRGTLMSGNTSDARYFSDGKVIAPMLPDFPNLTICKKCDTIFFLSQAKKVGEFEWGYNKTIKKEWKEADSAEFLTLYEYFRALDMRFARKKRGESFVRQRIWWSFNDRVRDRKPLFNSEEDKVLWKENILRLIDLVNIKDVSQKMLLAELHRNLGDFEKCLSILDSIDDPDMNRLKDGFTEQCNKKNTAVFELNFRA